MKINWKDLLLTYLLWIVLGIISAVVSLFFQTTPAIGLFLRILLLIIPTGFYFYRNQYVLKDAIKISTIFGFTVIPVYFCVVIIPLAIISIFIFTSPNSTMLIPGIDFVALLIELIISGIIFSVLGILSFFGTEYLRNRKTNKKPKD